MVKTKAAKAAKKRGKKSEKVQYFLFEIGKEGSVPQEAPNVEELVKLARENKWFVHDKRQNMTWLPHVSTVPIPKGMQCLRGSDWAQVRASTGEEDYYGKIKAEEEARNRWYAEGKSCSVLAVLSSHGTSAGGVPGAESADPSLHIPLHHH